MRSFHVPVFLKGSANRHSLLPRQRLKTILIALLIILAVSISARAQYKLTTLYEFTAAQGDDPGSLLLDADGNFYGVTNLGGTDNYGTAFELSAGTHVLTTLVNFDITNGWQPTTSLIMDSTGNLYGMTEGDSRSSESELFEISAGNHAFTVPAVLQQANGFLPTGSLITDAAGNIYGTAPLGGYNDLGTVFEISPTTGAVNVVASFNLTDGSQPRGGVIADSRGDLFGMTTKGGPDNDGVVFEIPFGEHTPVTLASFDGANGQNSDSGLVMDSQGNLYGVTFQGGDLTLNGGKGDGVVFEVAAGSNQITTLVTFDGTNGANPRDGLLMDSNGNLFGTTTTGAGGDGTVFEIPAGTQSLLTLVNFDGHNGGTPEAPLIEDIDGNIYGTTSGLVDLETGRIYWGTIFELSLPEPSAPALLALAVPLVYQRKRWDQKSPG